MPESKDSLNEMMMRASGRSLNKSKADPFAEETEQEEMTLAQMDGRYSTLRPANRNLNRLHVVLKDGKLRTLQYHFMDVMSTFDGREFVAVFAGTKHFQLTVRGCGPRFEQLYDLLTQHRLPYLREVIRDFGGHDETVVTAIEIKDVTPRSED